MVFVRYEIPAESFTNTTSWESINPNGGRLFLHNGCIAYTPVSTNNDKLMGRLGKVLQLTIVPFKNEVEMERAALNWEKERWYGGIVFMSDIKDEEIVYYKIRMPNRLRVITYGDAQWKTNMMHVRKIISLKPRDITDKTGGPPNYWEEGFIKLQWAIDNELTGSTIELDELQRMTYPPFNADKIANLLSNQLPFIFTLSYMFIVIFATRLITMEKESGVRELMKLHGLTRTQQWIAWSIRLISLMIISCIIITIFFKIKIPGQDSTFEATEILRFSSGSCFFVLIFLHSLLSITFILLLGAIFNKGYAGALGSAIIWFLTYVPYTFIRGRKLPLIARFFISFLPNMPISFGSELLSQFEGRSEGLHWSNITKDYLESYPFIYIFLFMIFDFFFYLLLAIYIDDVNPGEFGVPKSWYYPLTCCYHSCKKNKYEYVTDPYVTQITSESESNVTSNANMFETNSITNKEVIVDIIDLRKVFRGRNGQKKIAVDNLNMKVYENEITAFLGHNGAGKSTTINILTGIMKATSGSIIFNSTDIVKYPNEIRNSIGLCQQKNILFDYMTVDEHLYFFARLKNARDVEEEKEKYLGELGLEEKHSAQSRTLSGGQKRRLCIGIAFCGNSSLVILDEPTAGVDPSARREIWNILRSNKTGRTILLTTHFMDEADLLGDRIGIMVDGRLQCFGSSMFLKSRYGLGYRLTCSLKDKNNVGEEMSKQVIEWLRIEGGMKESSIITAIGNEMSFRLPKEGSFDGRLSAMLRLLDKKKEEFFIDKCGLSITTLEEVFLRAVKSKSKVENVKHYQESNSNDNDDGVNVSSQLIDEYVKKDYRVLYGMARKKQQTRGLFQKIYYGNIRRWWFAIIQILIPVFFTVMAIVSTKLIKSRTKEISLLIGPGTYNKQIFPYQFIEDFSNETKSNVKDCIEKTLSQIADSDGIPSKHLMAHNIEDAFPDNSPFKKCGNAKDFTDYVLCFGNAFGTYQYIENHIIGMTIDKKDDKLMVRGLFQDFFYHSASYSWNIVQNFRHNWLEGNGTLIRVYNHPLPLTVDDRKDKRSLVMETIGSFLVATNLLMGFAFLFASFTAYIVNEKNSKVKHLQYISGIGSFFYWGTHMIWNLLQYLFIIILVVVLVKVGDIRSFSETISRSMEIFLLLFLYGPGELCLMYILCQVFKKSATSVAFLTVFNLLSGIIPVTIVYIVQLVDDTGNISNYLNLVFMVLFPSHAFGMALLNYGVLYSQKILCEFLPILPVCSITYLSLNKKAIGRNLIVLAADSLFYFLLLFAIESDILNRFSQFLLRQCRPSNNQINTEGDEDVRKMRDKILDIDFYEYDDLPPIVVKGLSKEFKRKIIAVHPLYFQCEYGECFGLLGANGAGKTTTFDMMTGILYPTRGTAFIVSDDIRKNLKNVQRNIGYCPQFDALCEMMTGKELLTFYGRLRGIANEDLSTYTNLLLRMFNIEQYSDVIATKYSGGNKRKLSTAISLVGNSKILFLDEPTTGMDVAARRYLWTVINKLRNTQEHTLILTSHSMEECEALCTTAAIMINGQFKCLNSIQNLKSIYGEGVTISVKVADGENLSILEENLNAKFGSANVICLNRCDKIGQYQIKTIDISLSSMAEMFDYMSENKDRLNIKDFYVNQTTLEQIFNVFAQEQKPINE
ncbi:hypothetical protein SNEBB_003850 [Seison nebaliae]|nr:hypothetical protein SNEBB_003850 [Seison nebaliae]